MLRRNRKVRMAKILVKKMLNRQPMCRAKKSSYAGFIPLVSLLLLLTGCAVGGKVGPEPRVQTPQLPDGPTVTRFEDGRKGFLLTEKTNLDNNLRRDFEQAVVCLNNGDFEQAIELLEGVVYGSPEVTAPYINLAIAYRKIGIPQEAEEYLKTALELFPGHPVASNEYGLLLRKAGRFAEARALYEQALMSFPEYLPARKNLGVLCDLYLHDQECALAQYEQYSEADPADQQVKLWISELRLRQGE